MCNERNYERLFAPDTEHILNIFMSIFPFSLSSTLSRRLVWVSTNESTATGLERWIILHRFSIIIYTGIEERTTFFNMAKASHTCINIDMHEAEGKYTKNNVKSNHSFVDCCVYSVQYRLTNSIIISICCSYNRWHRYTYTGSSVVYSQDLSRW